MKNVLIRPIQSTDLVRLTAIQVYSIEQLSKSYYTPKQLQSLIKDKSRLRHFNESIWVAVIDGRLVGFAALANDKPWINGLFVHPEFARQKIGTQLIQLMEKEAIKLNWRCLWVYASLNGQSFYRSQGYEALTKDKIVLSGESFPVVLMKKILIPQTKLETISLILFWILLIAFALIILIIPFLLR
jgi:N-acetylglutamate synthase-like GNAT family acetyltransferase